MSPLVYVRLELSSGHVNPAAIHRDRPRLLTLLTWPVPPVHTVVRTRDAGTEAS